MNKIILLLATTLFLPSCLQTTAELRGNRPQQANTPSGETPPPPPIVTKQQKDAVESMRTDDINKDFRELNGRIEVVENQVNQLRDSEKVKALEMKVAQLESKIGLLETTVTDLNNKSQKQIAAAGIHGSDVKEIGKDIGKVEPIALQEANKLYDKRKWDEAILAFEEYRKGNPQGKMYADATFKIGICFQNMGMKDDAKAFFKEVVDKFPKSKEAGLAKGKLKKL
jgi:TolA-binding protein